MSIPSFLTEYIYEPGTTSIRKYTMTEASRVEVTTQARTKELIVSAIYSLPISDVDGTSFMMFTDTEIGAIADSAIAEMVAQGIIT